MAKSKSVIMDGRDIGTVVLKDSPYKFFLTASDEERARRRYEELKAKGQNLSFEEVLKQLRERDYNDTTREVTPLRKADDARRNRQHRYGYTGSCRLYMRQSTIEE